MLQRAKNGIMPTQKARGKELVGYRGGPSVRSEMKQAEAKSKRFLKAGSLMVHHVAEKCWGQNLGGNHALFNLQRASQHSCIHYYFMETLV